MSIEQLLIDPSIPFERRKAALEALRQAAGRAVSVEWANARMAEIVDADRELASHRSSLQWLQERMALFVGPAAQ